MMDNQMLGIKELIRSKEIKDALEQTSSLLDESNETQRSKTLSNICKCLQLDNSHPVHVGEGVIQDIALVQPMQQKAQTYGGKEWMGQIMSRPTANTNLLTQRINAIQSLHPSTQELIQSIGSSESSMLWALGMPNIKESWPLPLLFPTWPVLRQLNHIPTFLLLFHLYRGYLAPCMQMLYPLSTIFGPYVYIRRNLKWNLSLLAYLQFLKAGFITLMKPSYNLRKDTTRYITLFIYVAVFLYGIIQSFELAHMVRHMRTQLLKKLDNIRHLVHVGKTLLQNIPSHIFQAFHKDLIPIQQLLTLEIPSDLSGIYQIWTNDSIKESLSHYLRVIYIADVLCVANQMFMTDGWCRCRYVDTKTKMWGMGHPLLESNITNPVSFEKNMIITGPNAAGKTTYIKSILANMMLSQTFGFACAKKAHIQTMHALGSFIRVHDVVGKESLFEAELRRSATLIHDAHEMVKQGKRALYFLDEPMHSTPPVEGTSAAMAIGKHLGQLPGVTIFMTTHYHYITSLEKMEPSTWINVSMEAMRLEDGTFHFPYRIKNGPSFQCIALEILKEKSIPDDVIATAIEMKNKICDKVIENAS